MKELELLQQQLEQLIKRFTALQAEKDKLELAGQRQAEIITELKARVTVLESDLQLRSVALSASGHHSEDKKLELRTHLDRVIREIEKNLELL